MLSQDDFVCKYCGKLYTERYVEWIPYNQFKDIKEIGRDDSTALYSAIWIDGPLEYNRYSSNKKEWIKKPNKKVSLKCLYNSQSITNEFLNEVNSYTIKTHEKDIFKIYGITQNPETKDYIIQIGKDDSTTLLYSAIWMDGPLEYKHDTRKPWKRVPNEKVVLKWLCNSQSIVNEFLNEAKLHIDRYNMMNDIPKIYGITQNPDTNDYIMNSSGTLYSAIWMDGPLKYDTSKIMWERVPNKEVILKYQSQNIINKFLNEIKSYTFHNYYNDGIYGISQDPVIKDYIIVSYIDNYCKTCEIGKGGFATVYSAIWMDGPLRYDYNKKEYKREPNKEVVLKCLNNSQNITDEFLSEVKNYFINNDKHILQIYGISQNPNTKDYIMILQYAKNGNFDNYINDIINWFWFERLITLKNIIEGLKKIHENKMVHRDFHTGNILLASFNNSTYALSGNCKSDIYISDMGLCGEVSNIDQTKIYGVMPFVAPEVLKGKPYTQAADIYSFVLKICNGIRPEINEKEAPNCYIDLMKRCWDSNPDNRPNAIEVSELIELFCKSCNASEDMIEDEKIGKQFEEAEEYRKANLLSIKNSKLTTQNSQACYTSRLLNPFTEDLSKYDDINNNSVEIFDFTKISIEDETTCRKYETCRINLISWKSPKKQN
ncbi:uncharacterized protein OCT59_005898 [Rhizophagus irregularis]|nr:hypothetical protein OCT59_005898 [Rhizophagus irregularis]